jgi:hypothetical protein
MNCKEQLTKCHRQSVWPKWFYRGFLQKKCWETIKEDVMKAIVQLNNLNIAHLQWLNSRNILLLTKKDRAKDITEYKPINLIHAIPKLITKMISLWLAPLMNDLVSNAQSALIINSSIYDNFCMFITLKGASTREKSQCSYSSLKSVNPLAL